jgi:hypothetical protein
MRDILELTIYLLVKRVIKASDKGKGKIQLTLRVFSVGL